MRSFRIVSDGPERLRDAGEFAEERRRLLAELAQRTYREGNLTSFLQRLWLELKLRRAVRREMKKKFPPGALYVGADQEMT